MFIEFNLPELQTLASFSKLHGMRFNMFDFKQNVQLLYESHLSSAKKIGFSIAMTSPEFKFRFVMMWRPNFSSVRSSRHSTMNGSFLLAG